MDEEEVYKKDYAFIGYYGKDGTKYIDASGKSLGKFKNNANLTVYGKWEKVNFILTTNTNAEPNEEDTVQVTKYKTYNVNVPTRADYIFMGYFDKNGTQYIDANGDSLEVFTFNDDLTVYGKWGKRFNLNLNDSSLKSTSKIDGDLSIVYEYSNNLNFVVPTNDYYIFDGWYSQGEGGIKISDNNGNITVTIGDLINSTINLYAHWKQKYEDYTYISNASELLLINNNLNGKYMLLEDVDLSAYPQWTPIGGCYAEQVFTGVFDGNNHIIKNLTRTSEVVERNNRSYFGLFGYAKGATLKNVKFANANIDIYGPNNKNDSMKAYFATLVGYGDNTTIENIETNGKVSFNSKTDGATYLGGIIGLSNNCKVSSIINNQLIWGQREHIASGGICGFANSIELQTCINNASVTAIGNGWFGSGWSYAGGLIGYASNTSLIFAVSCQNNGSLSASTYGWDVGMKEMKKGNVYGNT